MNPNAATHPRYRVVSIRPKTLAMSGALVGVSIGVIQCILAVLYFLLLSGLLFPGSHGLETDVLFLCIPAFLGAVGCALCGAIFGWLVAVIYNHTHKFFGTFSIRLSRTYVRN